MELIIANSKHIIHAKDISTCIGESAKMRGTGIARRSPQYISKKDGSRQCRDCLGKQ